MALPLIAGAAIGIGALGKLGTGLFQGAKANRLEKENPFRAESIADELKLNLAEAEMRANQGLAAPAYNKAQEDIGRGTSTYLRAFGKTGRAGSLLSAIRGQNDALLNLDIADARAMESNRGILRQQRGIMAGEKARLWNVNVRQPYEKVQARIANLRGASNANIGGTFSDIGNIGSMLMGAGAGGGSASGNMLPNLPTTGYSAAGAAGGFAPQGLVGF